MIKLICYLYYRLRSYYSNGDSLPEFYSISAYIALVGLFWINISTIIFTVSTFFFQKSLFESVFTSNSLFNRFVITPILLMPIFLTFVLIVKVKLEYYIDDFANENIRLRKLKGKRILIYIVASIAFFFLSIISPLLNN